MTALGRHIVMEQHLEASDTTKSKQEPEKTSSVYDCTVEDVEYIYNKFSL